MVLESFIRIPEDSNLYHVQLLMPRVFALSILSTLVGMALAHTLFPSHASILWVAFVTMALMPFMVDVFREEEEEAEFEDSVSFLERNGKVVMIFLVLFFGVVLTTSAVFAFGSAFVPQGAVDALFAEQSRTLSGIKSLNVSITGNQFLSGLATLRPCDSFGSCALFIFQNNSWVLALIFIASFVYGAGAVFEIAWNASIIGSFIGLTFQAFLAQGASNFEAYSTSLFLALGFLPHGLLEIVGFSMAAISGSILSAEIVNSARRGGNRKTVLLDVLLLLVLGVLCVGLGALIEAGALAS